MKSQYCDINEFLQGSLGNFSKLKLSIDLRFFIEILVLSAIDLSSMSVLTLTSFKFLIFFNKD